MTQKEKIASAGSAGATAVRKKRGALLVHERLREDILWMRISPGAALDEVELASHFEVSRTPVREALLLLANEGFVQFLQNRTTIVAPLSLHNLSDFMDTFILLSRNMVRANATCELAKPEEPKRYSSTYREALLKGDYESAFRAQLDLFRHLASLTKNRFLKKYYLEAQDASVRTKLLYYFPHLAEADKYQAIEGIESVIDAVLACDPDRSDAAICSAILAEIAVIQRGLCPKFGHTMELEPNKLLQKDFP